MLFLSRDAPQFLTKYTHANIYKVAISLDRESKFLNFEHAMVEVRVIPASVSDRRIHLPGRTCVEVSLELSIFIAQAFDV